MSRVCCAFALLVLIHFSFPSQLSACGYDFIGDCSTSIGLRINGTPDSFSLASCPFGTVFNGLDLGLIQSLSLIKGKGVTWESCQNNVTNIALFYRVYEEGQSGGSWQSIDLAQDYFTLVGPYTTRYRSKTTNINLCTGLSIGNSYILEVYLRAEIDTIGDDFIPETFLFQNNNGSNFKMRFEYGGASAPPFTVVTTKQKHLDCFGDTTGVAGVSVYGNQAGLFYQWSGFNNNFPVLANLPAGSYTVTVSGQNGYTQSQTIVLQQPPALQNEFFNIVSVDCGGTGGQVSALASDGIPPYQYVWSTGQQGPVSSIPNIGLWQLTITDAHLCSAVFSVMVPGTPAVEETVFKEICLGETLSFEGQTFTATGDYDILLDGPDACDTLYHLQLLAFNAAGLLDGLPDSSAISCANPTVLLCVENIPGASYVWQNMNAETIGDSSCQSIASAGVYELDVIWQGIQASCAASGEVNIHAFFTAPELTFITLNASGPQNTDGGIVVKATGGTPSYSISSNEFGSSNDSLIVLENVPPGDYCFTVTGADGCSQTACATVSFSSATTLAETGDWKIYPNPAHAGRPIHIELPAGFASEDLGIEWSDLAGRTETGQVEQVESGSLWVLAPAAFSSGPALIRLRCGGVDFGTRLLFFTEY